MPDSAPPLSVASSKRPYAWSWIAILGLLTALGPLAIDMYLPALPSMAQHFGVTLAQVSNSVPAYFFGLAVGQLIYGPVSDRFGRKPPLYVGLSIFVLASVWCALAPDMSSLLAARVLQALGGCVGVVVARSAIRDCLSPAASSQAYAMLLLIMGVAPILAPLLGGVLLLLGWSSIFGLLALIGVINLLLIHFNFAETLPLDRRRPLALGLALRGYAELLLDNRFRTPVLAGAFLMGSLFVYISASSSILMGHFGVSAQNFGWLFGMNAAGLIALSQCNGLLLRRFSLLRLLQAGTLMQFVAVLWLLALVVLDQASLWGMMLGLFVVVSGIALTAPNSTALALADQGQRAGMASALIGSLQFALGLLGGALLHVLPFDHVSNVVLMMTGLVSAGAVATMVYSWRLRRVVG